MGDEKSFRIGIYQVFAYQPEDEDAGVPFSGLLDHIKSLKKVRLVETEDSRFRTLYGYERGFSDASPTAKKGVYHLIFSKYRDTNIPARADINAEESNLPLADGEALVEKNHAVYDAELGVLAWQENYHGSTATTVGQYIQKVFFKKGIRCDVAPMISKKAWEKMKLHPIVRKVTTKVALPVSADPYEPPGFLERLFGIGAQTMENMKKRQGAMALDMYFGMSPEAEKLTTKSLIAAMKGAEENPYVETLKVTVSDDDGTGSMVIDIMEDRIQDARFVAMNGPYPERMRMFTAIESVLNENRAIIEEVIAEQKKTKRSKGKR
jgi:hypothetical protein